MSRRRFSGLNNKYLKQQHELMLSFGYELGGFSKGGYDGHPVYTREGFGDLELSSTPRSEKNARRLLLVELRRRHPEHQMWRSMQKRKAKRRSTRRDEQERQARARAIVAAAERERRERTPTRIDLPYVGCPDCRYRWQSDIDPTGRSCPRCGGGIVSPGAIEPKKAA